MRTANRKLNINGWAAGLIAFLFRKGILRLPVFTFLLIGSLSGCFLMSPNEGGGLADFSAPREVNPAHVTVPEGYAIELVARNLTFPSAVTFDENGRVYVLEAGYSYGNVQLTPKLLRIESDGGTTLIAKGRNPPWTGVIHHDGAFYIAGGHREKGQILRVSPQGDIDVRVNNLPSLGDHFPGGPTIGSDGWLYFSQGTATNSGVVGEGNFKFGWPRRYPEFHDVPCENVTLNGKNYTTSDFMSDAPGDKASTGAFVPFGKETKPGQVIEGEVPCSGAVMRVPLNGGEVELVAWGFRNIYGMDWSPEGKLYVTENSYDVRGSRPVFGAGDLLYEVISDRWYGWPDFFAGIALSNDRFAPPFTPPPAPLLAKHPGEPPKPAAFFAVHSSSNGMDFSTSSTFGFAGDAFVAQFGDMTPTTGKVLEPVGFKVVRVDIDTGVIHDFAVNAGSAKGPASLLGSAGLERPLDVQFDATGTALYIVDFGVMTTKDGDIAPRPGTGVLWRVTQTEGAK